jgi:two-component system CheB/CheR fusion protein
MDQNIAEPSFIVGLGASAGGLEALERFFDHAATDSGGSYVVVMHLARDFKSVLDELLSRHTGMPVRPVEDGAALLPNTVYVIQPGTEIEVTGLQFRVTARPAATSSARVSSIDVLLTSIASFWGSRGAAVILSGSGTDGAQGVVAVHGAGGVVFAQSPESAKFDSMPIAAIATNSVSGVDTPETLAQMVVESILLPRVNLTARKSAGIATALQKILASVVGASHLDASQYTQSTFERRVQRRMKELDIDELSVYSDRVQADRNEAQALSETLLIGVTDFFRDEAAFASLARQVAPELIHRASAERRAVRIWVPGCASGEEAYSIAIVLAEAATDFPSPIEFQIFATDVHKGLLAEAARGEYPSERMQNVSDERRRNFFTRTSSGSWQIDAKLRKNIVFAPHDVLMDPPFTRLDLVSCRNLLIYFSVEAQQRVIGSFAFGLLEKGFLFLGSSETVGAQRESFELQDVRRRIFRRTRAQSRSPALPRAVDPSDRFAVMPPSSPPKRSLKARESFLQPAYAAMLRDFAPPSFLVSATHELLHTFGDARRFLRAPEGVARLDVTDMCDSALKTPLAAGIARALRDKTDLSFSRIELNSFPAAGMLVDVKIKPLAVETETPYALILVEELNASALTIKTSTPALAASADLSDPRSNALEIELLRTREALQSTIEEIETANEELQATNEELMSSNEELQSTNEELSSLNEELHSVNAEHFRQNNELVRLTRDFDALLHATEIGVLFFDELLHIRRFTRLIVELFQFTDTDIGRPLRTFRSPFLDFDLEGFLRNVMRDGVTEEAQVQDQSSRSWLLRAAGYPDQKGVVLSVISIARLGAGGFSTLHVRERILAQAAPFAGDALMVVAPDTGLVEYANRSAWNRFGVPEAPQQEFRFSHLTPELGDTSWTSWLSTIGVGASATRLDIQIMDNNANIFPVDLLATLVRDESRTHAVIRIIENRDRARAVSELQERARTFAISNRELEQFATVVAHDLRAPLRHLNQFAQFLLMELGGSASSTVQEYLQIIQSSAASMSGMIERLLEYARIGAGAAKFSEVSLKDCVDQAAENLRTEIAAANAVIECGKLPSIKGDRILLARLFQNLVANSIKYCRKDVVPRIAIQANSDGKYVQISVADNGIGIDPVHKDEVFKMFSRLHSDAEYSGHGMGLAICKRVCEIHGGSIDIDDTEITDEPCNAFVGTSADEASGTDRDTDQRKMSDGSNPPGSRFIIRLPTIPAKLVKKVPT